MARFGKSAPCKRSRIAQKYLRDLLLLAKTLPFLLLLTNQWKSVVLGSRPRNDPCSDRRSLKTAHYPPKQWRWLWRHSLGCSTRLQEVQHATTRGYKLGFVKASILIVSGPPRTDVTMRRISLENDASPTENQRISLFRSSLAVCSPRRLIQNQFNTPLSPGWMSKWGGIMLLSLFQGLTTIKKLDHWLHRGPWHHLDSVLSLDEKGSTMELSFPSVYVAAQHTTLAQGTLFTTVK